MWVGVHRRNKRAHQHLDNTHLYCLWASHSIRPVYELALERTQLLPEVVEAGMLVLQMGLMLHQLTF